MTLTMIIVNVYTATNVMMEAFLFVLNGPPHASAYGITSYDTVVEQSSDNSTELFLLGNFNLDN